VSNKVYGIVAWLGDRLIDPENRANSLITGAANSNLDAT